MMRTYKQQITITHAKSRFPIITQIKVLSSSPKVSPSSTRTPKAPSNFLATAPIITSLNSAY